MRPPDAHARRRPPGPGLLPVLAILLATAATAGAQPDAPAPDRLPPGPLLLPPVIGQPPDPAVPGPTPLQSVLGQPVEAPREPAMLGPPLVPPPDGLATRLPPALRAAVESLGASSGVPDGAGVSWYPSVPVRGQNARMGLANYQLGATLPVSTSESGGWYANGAARLLDVRTTALLPTDRIKFPGQFWDVQAGGAYLRQLDGGWSWGVTLNVGSASDHPFNDLSVLTVSALAFARKPAGEKDGWLFFVVSTTNGQIGHNIPIPGFAYEYNADRLRAVVGFPFLTVDYRPTDATQLEFVYAALTDVQLRGSYYLTPKARAFVGYEWVNQAWLRADRRRSSDQTFLYEMRAEAGFGYRVPGVAEFRASAGYAFDRFFVENAGLGFGGRNRVDLAPGPFAAVQLELKF